jgi:hypothetical protein
MSIQDIWPKRMISSDELDRKMQILHDIKKQVIYAKTLGKFWWGDKTAATLDDWNGPFDSFLEAVDAAIEPYVKDPDAS